MHNTIADNPQAAPASDASKELERWIDEAEASGADVLDVAAHIAELTWPGDTGDGKTSGDAEISPDLSAAEGWLWPWNRAGFLYIETNRPDAAVVIFQCAYLAAIHFQHVRQYRIHKGMPLCNVAYAYLSAKKPELARVPALLGMTEDAMTAGNPTETASFQNLLAAGYHELPARSLGELFISLTRRRGLFPLYPEIVLDCAIREYPIVSLDWVKAMRIMAAEFTSGTIKSSLEKLTVAWHELLLSMNRRLSDHGGPSRTVTSRSSPATLPVPAPGSQQLTTAAAAATGLKPLEREARAHQDHLATLERHRRPEKSDGRTKGGSVSPARRPHHRMQASGRLGCQS